MIDPTGQNTESRWGSSPCLDLSVLPGALAVCRLPPDAALPAGVLDGPFAAVVRTPDELSVVVPEARAERDWPAERGWRALKVHGPLNFALTGILASLSRPLADAGLSLFAVSTYDTDYLLVRDAHLDAACRALTDAGHRVRT